MAQKQKNTKKQEQHQQARLKKKQKRTTRKFFPRDTVTALDGRTEYPIPVSGIVR